MKRFAVLGLIICLIGCTTMQPVSGSSFALQQRIASGELLKIDVGETALAQR